MVTIFLHSNKICARLDPRHPAYANISLIFRSMLSSRALDENTWVVSYNDLLRLRKYLDASGLVQGRYVTEDAFGRIQWIYEQREKNRKLKEGADNERFLEALRSRIKTPLYQDQVTGVSYAVNNRRSGIFDEMGLGKSLETLASIAVLKSEVRRTLLICPYTVQIGFLAQIAEHTYLKGISVPNGRQRALEFIRANKDSEWDIMMVHPENLISGDKKSFAPSEIQLALMGMLWDMVVVDEFHMYKNPAAKRTQCVLALLNDTRDRSGNTPRAILLTGTPVSESPFNAFVVLKVLSRDYIPDMQRFEDHFVVKRKVQLALKDKKNPEGGKRRLVDVMKVEGYKNLDELKDLLDAVSIRRTKDEMTGFPDRVFMVRDVVLEGKQKKLYDGLCGAVVEGLSRDSLINLEALLTSNKMIRLRQLMNHPALIDEDGDSAKYLECDAVLEEVLSDPEAKVVIWTEFRDAVDLLYSRYDKQYGAVKIYGGVDNDSLERIKQEFEHSERPRVAVCIPAKAGTGVDFLARARTAIYIERPHSFVQLKQSLDRIHRRVSGDSGSRLNQIRSKPATLIFLDVVDSVDTLIRSRSIDKQRVVDAITVSDEKLTRLGRSDVLRYLGGLR